MGQRRWLKSEVFIFCLFILFVLSELRKNNIADRLVVSLATVCRPVWFDLLCHYSVSQAKTHTQI